MSKRERERDCAQKQWKPNQTPGHCISCEFSAITRRAPTRLPQSFRHWISVAFLQCSTASLLFPSMLFDISSTSILRNKIIQVQTLRKERIDICAKYQNPDIRRLPIEYAELFVEIEKCRILYPGGKLRKTQALYTSPRGNQKSR